MSEPTLVVGAGPVGLTMAAELARYGLPVRIIDRAAGPTDKSKALVIWSRTLELIDRMGCAPTFLEAGLKVKSARIVAGAREIAQIHLDEVHSPYPFALMIPQSETERLMEEHLRRLGVEVERRVELARFEQDEAGVSYTLEHADGREETGRAPWLIGCDGAHSTVRHALGVGFEGETLPSEWVLADTHLDGLPDGPPEVRIHWHRDGALALFPIAPGRYRVIADVGDAQEEGRRPDPTLEEIQAILDARGPGGVTISSPFWLASFRINERKVVDYRSGRVFLAGDAAHIHSPAGGQGMNTGMQDACNLAWKLAMVEQGVASPEPMLASYNIERGEVGRRVLQDAGRFTWLAILRGGIQQEARNAIASLVFGLAPVRRAMADQLTELSIGYPKSPLTFRSHHASGGPAPGDRAPLDGLSEPVGSGSTPRFAIYAAPDAEGSAMIAKYPAVLEPEPRKPFAEGGIWLVRPDGYISSASSRWAETEADLRKMLGEPGVLPSG
ncbi:MAG: FAD-dependent monooxygenase [Isosphaeraceae bacterium]